MSHRILRRAQAVVVGSVLFFALGCLPMPPGSYTPQQFAPGTGPDLVRATMFQGLGAWWDVWDWSPSFTNGRPPVTPATVDKLAAHGVQALYIQTSRWNHSADILDPQRLRAIIDRCRAKGIRVVGWYLPEHVDEAKDMRRMNAAIAFGVDGFAVNIESDKNPDVAARTAILLREVAALRAQHPKLPLAAIPVAPIVWEQLNRTWWPNFPYRQLARYFDVWMPQNYWTNRAAGSRLRHPYTYNVENIRLLRQLTGVPWLPVHPIGGLSPNISAEDVVHMYNAIADTNSIGGSIYDSASFPDPVWPSMKILRRPK